MDPAAPLHRIMVMGPPGSGKSTVARQLGAALSLAVHHLDALYHAPGWRPRPSAAFHAEVDRIAATPAWIIDGNYVSAAATRLATVQLILVLDLPRHITFPRLMRRIAAGWGTVRPDSAPGCPEKVDFGFLHYAWTWRSAVRPRVLAAIAGHEGRTVPLTDTAAIAALVERLSLRAHAATS